MMGSFAAAQPLSLSFGARSMGMKFFIVLGLALGMSISGFFVDNLTTERAQKHGLLAASAENPMVPATTVFGIKLADSYRSTRRSLHYITLFLGLIFLTYFLFEASTGKRVHPAQYALVGIAQTIFYLLLLSLAEKIGFDWSFLIAGGSTVLLFAANIDWLFGSRKIAARALAIFTAVYTFIYVLLRIEAYALLVGAAASFVAVAVAMYLTRNIDWYRNEPRSAAIAGGGAPATSRESWLE